MTERVGQGETRYGQGLPLASGWKRLMPGDAHKPTYDHEWVSGIINENNKRGRLLIERDEEIVRLRKMLDGG